MTSPQSQICPACNRNRLRPGQDICDGCGGRLAQYSPSTRTNTCPHCGTSLSFIQQYQRWYCYSCKTYAPAEPQRTQVQDTQQVCPTCGQQAYCCPTCRQQLHYVKQYQRWYFFNCRTYPTIPWQPQESTPACPSCGQRPFFIQQYQRWYCYGCGKYI